jgi:hypothetical protein
MPNKIHIDYLSNSIIVTFPSGQYIYTMSPERINELRRSRAKTIKKISEIKKFAYSYQRI